jgi:hypothetical protein
MELVLSAAIWGRFPSLLWLLLDGGNSGREFADWVLQS